MRRINPAVTAGLSAAIVMGVGTAAIVSMDNMLRGDMPVAVAAQQIPNLSYTEPSTTSGTLTCDATDYTFSGSGQIVVTATGHTGPFHVSWTLPKNWTDRGATITTLSDTPNPTTGLNYTCTKSDDQKTISLVVLGAGMEAGNTITINYTAKTDTQTGQINTDPDATTPLQDQIDAILSDLSSLTWIRDGISFDTDYSQPNVTPSQTPIGSTLYLNDSGDGKLTFTFAENCAGVTLTAPVLSSEISGIISPFTYDQQGWTLTKAGQTTSESTPVAFDSSHNYNKDDEVTINFHVKVPWSRSARIAIGSGKSGNVSATCSVGGYSLPDGTIVGKRDTAFTASSPVSLGLSSLSASKPSSSSVVQNVTNPNIAPTMHDELEVPIRVSATGLVQQQGWVRVALNNVGATGVRITGVKSGNQLLPETDYENNGDYVDIKVPALGGAVSYKDYGIMVICGDIDNAPLHGKTVGVNADAATFTDDLKSLADLRGETPMYTFKIEAPTATIESAVTDPTVVVQDQQSAFSTEMTSNLGDVATFKVTFTNDSDRTIKGVTLDDKLRSFSKDGSTELDNTTACVDILTTPEITLTKVSGTGESTSIDITATLTPPTLAEHPWQLHIEPSNPSNAINLLPGESLVLQYNAQMGHTNITASSQNMRGATITNDPEMDAQNFIDGTSVEASDITKSSVKIATAQLSARLDATKDKVPLGEKTTYFVTVQSVEQRTTLADEYAIGLHLTSILDEHSRSFGYKYNKDSVKLYHVSDNVATAVPANDYAVAWIEPELGSDTLKEMSFTVDIKDGKEGLYKMKNVAVSNPNTSRVGGESASQDASQTVQAESDDDTDSKKGDVKALAKQIHEGFIITYDGVTDHVDAALAGELPANTDVLVRADNASFSVDSKKVTIVGEEIRTPTTGWKADPNALGQNPNDPNNPNNPNNRNGRNEPTGPLVPTDASLPVSIGAVLAGVAGWAVTKYRKIKRR